MLCCIWRSVAALWWQAQRSARVCVYGCVYTCWLIRTACFFGLSGLGMCAWVCVQERVSRFALPPSLLIVGERILSHWVAAGTQMWTENNMLDLAWEWSWGWRRGEHHDVSSCLPTGWGTQWQPSPCMSVNTYFSTSRSSGSSVMLMCRYVWWVEGEETFCLRKRVFILEYASKVYFVLSVIGYECPWSALSICACVCVREANFVHFL